MIYICKSHKGWFKLLFSDHVPVNILEFNSRKDKEIPHILSVKTPGVSKAGQLAQQLLIKVGTSPFYRYDFVNECVMLCPVPTFICADLVIIVELQTNRDFLSLQLGNLEHRRPKP